MTSLHICTYVGLCFHLFMTKNYPLAIKLGFYALNANFGRAIGTSKTAELNSKFKATIDLDGCAYILEVLHQSFIKAFREIC